MTTNNSSKIPYRFTGDAKGSRKYEGWNTKGMTFFNDLLVLIKKERNCPGCVFERNLLETFAKKPKKGRRSGAEADAPRASDELSMLMPIVGVDCWNSE